MKKWQVFLINDTGKLDNDTQSKKKKALTFPTIWEITQKWIVVLNEGAKTVKLL